MKRDNTPIHRVADQHRSGVRHAARLAFAAGRNALGHVSKDNASEVASRVAEAIAKRLKESLPTLLQQVFEAGGATGARELTQRLRASRNLAAAPARPTFVVVTQDHSGLGWVKKLVEEGEQVVYATRPSDTEPKLEAFALVGGGLAPVMTLEDALADTSLTDAVWIFDHNHNVDAARELITRGTRVFPPSIELGESLEHDRSAAVSAAGECGLDMPPTQEFEDNADGLEFLDANPNIAYVFKPNNSEFNFLTFVPNLEDDAKANRQVYQFLKYLPELEDGFVLQERKSGVETNVEVWFDKGEPFFAFVCLENKRRGQSDSGEMCGCAGDVTFTIPMSSPIIGLTIGKMFEFYRSQEYTGFADVNVIIGDNKVWFLEVCDRFGYNSHPNLFLNLAMQGLGQIVLDWLAGTLKTDCYSRFRQGFGASMTGFLDHPRMGLPLNFADAKAEAAWYPFDCYKEGDDWMLTGYSMETGIYAHFDYTIEHATQACVEDVLRARKIVVPDMTMRTDLGHDDYPSSPRRRYDALRSMRLV